MPTRTRVLGMDLPLVDETDPKNEGIPLHCPNCRVEGRPRLRRTLIQHGMVIDRWWEIVQCRHCKSQYCIYSEVPCDPMVALFVVMTGDLNV